MPTGGCRAPPPRSAAPAACAPERRAFRRFRPRRRIRRRSGSWPRRSPANAGPGPSRTSFCPYRHPHRAASPRAEHSGRAPAARPGRHRGRIGRGPRARGPRPESAARCRNGGTVPDARTPAGHRRRCAASAIRLLALGAAVPARSKSAPVGKRRYIVGAGMPIRMVRRSGRGRPRTVCGVAGSRRAR